MSVFMYLLFSVFTEYLKCLSIRRYRDVKSLGLKMCLNVFFSAGTAWSAAAWPPVNCACVPQLFQQPINTTLRPAFLRKFVCEPLCCVSLQIQTFYQILVLVAEYHIDC